MRTNTDNLQSKTNSFQGIYRGVIEDNNDLENLGRCKIRIWGIHTDDITPDELEGIPTENLPWAEPCLGLIEGSVSGAGLFSIPLQGSHVFLFFEGGNWESPRYFATVPGQPVDAPDPTVGFNDPTGTYPRKDRLDEPDWHRLARGVSEGTIVDHKDANLDLQVTKADGEVWDEPESAFAAQYPKNIVLATHRGITIEIDNTEGAERVHIYHPSNTYIEIDAIGNVVFKNDGNRFEITRNSRNKHVLIDDNETIDSDKTSKVGKNEEIEIGQDRIKRVGSNDRETIGKDRVTTVGQNDTKSVGTDWNVSVGGNITIEADGDVTIIGANIHLNP